MFCHDFNDSRAYDGTIRYASHCFRLFRFRNTKTNGYRNICIFANRLNDGFNICLDFATHACNTEGRHAVHKTFCVFCDHFDAVFRCGSDQGYHFNAVFISYTPEFPFFFKGHIWHDNTRDTNLFAEGKEFFTAEYIDWIQVGHEHEWYCYCIITTAQTTHHIKDIVNFYACR